MRQDQGIIFYSGTGLAGLQIRQNVFGLVILFALTVFHQKGKFEIDQNRRRKSDSDKGP